MISTTLLNVYNIRETELFLNSSDNIEPAR